MAKLLILYVQVLKEKLFIAYMMFVLEALDKFAAIGESFSLFVDNFKAAYNHLNEVYLKYDHKLYAEKLRNANDKRSKAFSKFNNYVRSFLLNTTDEAKTDAAKEVVQIIGLYGASGIFSLGLREISTQLVNMIEDLEDRYAAEIQLLGAAEMLAELRAAQMEFSDLYFESTQYDSEVGRKAMAEARKRMTEAYRSLVTIINENVPFDTEERYQGFIRLLNTEIRTLFSHTGQSDNISSSSDSNGEATVPMKNATFEFANGNVQKFKIEVGAPIIAPDNTFGYIWDKEIPEFMPNKNIVFREVPISTAESTATFHFLDHSEEEIKQLVGSVLKAPANTEGCIWEPAVPATMPAEDTAYYEMRKEDSGGSGSGGGNTGSGSGNTNPTDPDDDPDALKPGDGGDDPDL